MSSAHHAIGCALLDKAAGHLDGGVFLAPENVRRLFVHVNHVIGLNDLAPGIAKVKPGKFCLNLGRISHQKNMKIVQACGFHRARNHHGGTKIPAHGVNGDDGLFSHHSASGRAIT